MSTRRPEEGRERNERGQYAQRIPPEAVLSVFESRTDAARPLTADDVMEELDCSRRTAHNKLGTLVERGDLETRKIGARGRVWWIPIETTDERTGSADADGYTGPVRNAVEDADLPGTGSTLEERREALLAAYDYLAENPNASKSDFLAEVYPDHPAGYETAEGWWNALHPSLKQLPGVDAPKERGRHWRFLGG